MSEDHFSEPGPRSMVEWYRDARRVLFACEAEADRLAESEAPTDREHLMAAVRLSKQLVDLLEPPEQGTD